MIFISKQILIYIYVDYNSLLTTDYMKLYLQSLTNPSDMDLIVSKIDPIPSTFDMTSNPSVVNTDSTYYIYNPSINPSAIKIRPDSNPSIIDDEYPYKSYLFYYSYIVNEPGDYNFAVQFCDEIGNCGEISDMISEGVCLTPKQPEPLKNAEFSDDLNILSFEMTIPN